MRPTTWLAIGAILGLLLLDLKMASSLFGTTMLALFADAVQTVAGWLRAAMMATE